MGETRQITGNGTSLAVRQFMAFARGEDVPHEPSNPWRVEEVTVEGKRYCSSCYGDRWFDVVQAVTCDGKSVTIRRCRCCGAEIGG